MTTTARTPSRAAASATPCAWFPAEEQTTPRARSSSDNRSSFTSGPRSLYEPVLWKSSALRRTSKPVSSDSSREVRSGVRRACRATSSCTARESGRAETRTSGASHVGSDRVLTRPRRAARRLSASCTKGRRVEAGGNRTPRKVLATPANACEPLFSGAPFVETYGRALAERDLRHAPLRAHVDA